MNLQDLTKRFAEVKSIEVVTEMSGNQLHITLDNGTIIAVCPDNQCVHFYKSAEQLNAEDTRSAIMVSTSNFDTGEAEFNVVTFRDPLNVTAYDATPVTVSAK
jgi:hypothetical protein